MSTTYFEDIEAPRKQWVKPKNRPVMPTKPPGSLSSSTRYARELFLHGEGDGKRIVNIDKLSELSGVSPSTIRNWLPVWERESKSIVANAQKPGFSIELTIEKLDLQREHVELLSTELKKLKVLIPTLTPGSDLHASTLNLHMRLLKAWEESSGFRAYADVGATLAKELAKQKAKQGAKGDDEPRPVEDAAFMLPSVS